MKRFLSLVLFSFCINANAQNVDYKWALSADDAHPDAVTVDGSGNIYLTGYYTDTMTFGGVTLTGLNPIDMFIVKLNSSGTVLWAQSFAGDDHDNPLALVTDSLNNLIVTGNFQSTSLTFGSVVLTNPNSPYGAYFIAKFDSNGNTLWAKTASSGDWGEGTALVTDAANNIYVTGWFSGTTFNHGGTILTNNGVFSSDIFLIKYDPAGNIVWAKSCGGGDWDTGWSLAIDDSNNLYVGGSHAGNGFTFASNTLPGNNYYSTLLLKYDSSGNEIWARDAGALNADNDVTSIAVDHAGNIYMTGYFDGANITFGNQTATNNSLPGNQDVFLVKYDSNGNAIWAKSVGGSMNEGGSRLSWDGKGGLYVTGYFESPNISFAALNFTNNSAKSGFVVKYDPNGNVRWADVPAGSSENSGNAIYALGDGSVYLTGSYNAAPITFGTHNLNLLGNTNMFLVKMSHCAAYFSLTPDSVPQVWYAINQSLGTPPFSYLWNWGDGNSTAGPAPSHTYANPGFYNICLSITDALGCTDTYCDSSVYLFRGPQGLPITVHVISPVITSVSESDKFTALLYPNPASDLLHVSSLNQKIKTIMIRNIIGQKIKFFDLSETQEISLDIADLKPGMYLIEMSDSNGKTAVARFIRSER